MPGQRLSCKSRVTAPAPLRPSVRRIMMDTPQPEKAPPPGFGVVACLAGIAMILWGAFGSPSQFNYGPWPVILLGAIFTLCGFQVLRVTVLHQAVSGLASSMIAILVFSAFCTLFSWAALSKKVIFLDKQRRPIADATFAHIACGVVALICAVGVVIFIFKLVSQLRRRE